MKLDKVTVEKQFFGAAKEIFTTSGTKVPFPVDGFFGFTHLAKYTYDPNRGINKPAAPIDSILKQSDNKTVTLFVSK